MSRGRPATSHTARIKALEAAKSRAAKLKRGERLSAMPMAELLKVRWPTLRDWCDDLPGFAQSGCFIAGGNGIEWEFRAARTVDWLLSHFRGVVEKQAAESRRLSKAIGVTLPQSETPSLAETKDLVNLTVTIVAAAEKQNFYTPAEEVAAFIEGYNEAVVSSILGVRTKIDPNGNLPIHVRKAVDEHLRSVAASVHARAQTFVEGKRAGIQQGRAG